MADDTIMIAFNFVLCIMSPKTVYLWTYFICFVTYYLPRRRSMAIIWTLATISRTDQTFFVQLGTNKQAAEIRLKHALHHKIYLRLFLSILENVSTTVQLSLLKTELRQKQVVVTQLAEWLLWTPAVCSSNPLIRKIYIEQ